jgi:KipI family sensor histidine kinase inhibitor
MGRASPLPVEPRGSRRSYRREPFIHFAPVQTGDVHSVPVGRRALLVEVDDAATALALADWARQARVGAGEIVPGAATVLFDEVDDLALLRDVLTGWTPTAEAPARAYGEIAVRYDGPDLAFVAEAWGTDPAGVVERHSAVEYVAAFCGFAPGFAYLAGLADELAVPRLVTPRSRVPAGSVALAGAWCGIYPTASPGGWRILGSTDALLWDQVRDEPALLPPGTRVRFVPA